MSQYHLIHVIASNNMYPVFLLWKLLRTLLNPASNCHCYFLQVCPLGIQCQHPKVSLELAIGSLLVVVAVCFNNLLPKIVMLLSRIWIVLWNPSSLIRTPLLAMLNLTGHKVSSVAFYVYVFEKLLIFLLTLFIL